MIRNKTGVWGEIYAVRYLRDNKYKIITVNYSNRFGEIDIIAEKKNVVCFVEVKTRGENPLFSPADAVDEGKQERCRAAAKQFLSMMRWENPARFDVCEVWVDENIGLTNLNYIENAFE